MNIYGTLDGLVFEKHHDHALMT